MNIISIIIIAQAKNMKLVVTLIYVLQEEEKKNMGKTQVVIFLLGSYIIV